MSDFNEMFKEHMRVAMGADRFGSNRNTTEAEGELNELLKTMESDGLIEARVVDGEKTGYRLSEAWRAIIDALMFIALNTKEREE